LATDHAGIVAAVLAEPGQVVSAGQAVLRVARDGEREIAIALPETDVAGLKPGAEAAITLWSGGKNYRGRLRELAPAADPATRTYPARVTVLDADEALVLGMTATVRFAGAKPAANALIVPLAALYQQGTEPAVWVVGADQTVALRKLRVSAYTDIGAVVAEGLVAGERIVAAGVHKLSAGEKVRLADAKAATP
jgi:RND family efflux transporter MFP subunit